MYNKYWKKILHQYISKDATCRNHWAACALCRHFSDTYCIGIDVCILTDVQ